MTFSTMIWEKITFLSSLMATFMNGLPSNLIDMFLVAWFKVWGH